MELFFFAFSVVENACELHERQFNQQSLVFAGAKLRIAFIHHLKPLDEQAQIGSCGLSLIFLRNRFAHFHERYGLRVFTYQQVAEVSAKTGYEVVSVKTFVEHFIKKYQAAGHIFRQNQIGQFEIVVVIQYVEVLNYSRVGEVATAKRHYLVEDRKRIAHSTVCFGSNHVQCFRFGLNAFFGSNGCQVIADVFYFNAVEVENLATAQDGWNNLVLFGGCQNENGVCRWLFECFQECVEGRRREHVNLVDDIHLVLACLRRYAHAVNNRTDVIYAVVGSGIEFEHVELHIVQMLADGPVHGFGENAGAGCFTYTTRSGKQIGLRNLIVCNSTLQGGRDVLLSHHRFPGVGTVLSC